MRTGSSLGQSVEGDVLHPVEMDEGRRDDENVKYLVGLEPEVTFSRQEPLANYLEIKFLSQSLLFSQLTSGILQAYKTAPGMEI